MKPKVSVIVPMFNAEKFITTTIDSILQQTLTNIELIVIDDRSTDKSLEIVRKYKDSRLRIYPSVRKYHEWNARNLGLQISTGDYVFFMDHDDILLKDALEVLYETAENVQAESVHFNSYYTNLDDRFSLTDEMRLIRMLDSIPADKFLPMDLEWRLFQKDFSFSVMAWQKLMRRNFLIESGLYFPNLWISSDSMHFFGELCLAKKIFVVDGCGYVYRQNSTNQMRSSHEKKIHYVLENLQPMIDFMEEIFSKKMIQDLPRDLQLQTEMNEVNLICVKFAAQAVKNGMSLSEIDDIMRRKKFSNSILFHMAVRNYLNECPEKFGR